MFLLNRDSMSFGLNDAPELAVLLVKALFSLIQVPLVGFGMLRHVEDEGVRHVNRIG